MPQEHIENDKMNQYLNRIEGMKASQTFGSRRTALRRFNTWLDSTDQTATDIDALDIEDYLAMLSSEGYAPNTISTYYDGVRNFYNFLERKGVMDENPAKNVNNSNIRSITSGTKKHNETDVVYVTEDEKEQLVEHVPNPRVRNELIVRLLWQTGVRGKELSDVKLDHIDRDQRSIWVYSTKTDSSRTVFYQPSLDFLLDQWIDGGYRDAHGPANTSKYLFPGKECEKLRPRFIRNAVTEAAENAGIQEEMYEAVDGSSRHRIGSHSLRHGHAVYALRSGINIRTLQKHLGHSTLTVTEKYLQIVNEDVQNEYQRFGDT